MESPERLAYVTDILRQPEALRTLVRSADGMKQPLHAGLALDRFDRVVVTGMGTSLFGTYPAWLTLVGAGVPAWWIDTAELVHYATSLITADTLVWITSQSGRSAEVRSLLDCLADSNPRNVLATTNDVESPLAQQADVVIPLHAGREATVATCTYVNTLAASLTVARALIDQPVPMDVWESTADAMEAYLSASADDGSSLGDWPQLGGPLIIVGRGPSTASAWTAALVLKEGAKVAAEGLTAAAFRHGPLELADERLVVFILEGQRRTAAMNERLASDLLDLGAHVTWVGQHPHAGTHNFQLPSVAQLAQPIVETLPFQLLSVSLARRNGFEAGAFRNQAKVTTVE